MPGQVIVLHVPVGRAVPAEPGPQKIATAVPDGARAQKIDARADDATPKSRYDKRAKAHTTTRVVKAAAHGGKTTKSRAGSSQPAEKASKVAAGRPKAASGARKSKQK